MGNFVSLRSTSFHPQPASPALAGFITMENTIWKTMAENFLDTPVDQVPIVVNDRGSLMKAMDVKQMFRDLGLTHTFSCSRTLNDNLYVESLFGTMKTNPVYPGLFSFEVESVVQRYSGRYAHWYSQQHYRSRNENATPSEALRAS